jgi:hypothetical protein
MYTVTRQVQWPDGLEVVEVSQGGLDYANPDVLSPRYPSEGETYPNPRDAAAAAIDICRRWRKDGHKNARVAYGATMGFTMPFSPCTFKELREWAERRYRALVITLPSCESCGATIWDSKDAWWSRDYQGYCSQKCVEDAYAAEVNPDDNP